MTVALLLATLCLSPTPSAHTLPFPLDRGVCIDRQLHAVPPDPAMRIQRDDFRLIKSMGFQFAKVILNPEVVQDGARVDPSKVWFVDQILADAAAEGLPIVLCIHPEPEFKRSTLGSPEAFDRFEAFMGDLAKHVARRSSPKRLALQLMTEPFGGSDKPGDWNGWDTLQHRLWRKVRAQMPGYTLILSGDRVGQIDGLADITPVRDDRVLYSFTFYAPDVFTQQGAPWIPGGMPYLKDLPFPSGPQTLALLPKLLAGVPAQWHPDIRARVEAYAAEKWDNARLAACIEKAVTWRRRYPGTRLWCAEFGCYQAAAPADRLAYLSEVRRLFEENCIGWAYWSYNEAFTVMTRDRIPFGPAAKQTPDADLLRALMPGRRQARQAATSGDTRQAVGP